MLIIIDSHRMSYTPPGFKHRRVKRRKHSTPSTAALHLDSTDVDKIIFGDL